MITINYPTKDYDFETYFKLDGHGNGVFYLYPELSNLRADYAEYDMAQDDHMNGLKPITDGEWVLIDGKEYVTVIGNADCPARFLAADSMPTMVMDGAGNLTINGTVLEYEGKPVSVDDVEKPCGDFRLGRALRVAQIAGLIPDHCEYVLNDGGGLDKIIWGI